MHRSPLVGRIGLVVLLGSCLAAACSHAQATQPGPCDTNLHSAQGHPYAYRNRGDRCEGVYAKPVSSTSLSVASITAAFGDYSIDSVEPLSIHWAPPPPPTGGPASACGPPATGASRNDVHLRAQSLQPRVYYRMDTIRSTGDTTFAWPKDTLGALAISRSALGVLGWTTRLVGGIERPVYLPLRVRQDSPASKEPATEYRVLVIPGSELAEVYVTLARLDPAGDPAVWLRRGEALGYGYYPAERPIRIVLPLADAPGCYRLEVTANLRAGGTTGTALWLYDAWP